MGHSHVCLFIYRGCRESTHWHIDYYILYTLNPHNETPLHFHVHTLSLTHLHRFSAQGTGHPCACGVCEFIALSMMLLSLGAAGVCVCVGAELWWVEVRDLEVGYEVAPGCSFP